MLRHRNYSRSYSIQARRTWAIIHPKPTRDKFISTLGHITSGRTIRRQFSIEHYSLVHGEGVLKSWQIGTSRGYLCHEFLRPVHQAVRPGHPLGSGAVPIGHPLGSGAVPIGRPTGPGRRPSDSRLTHYTCPSDTHVTVRRHMRQTICFRLTLDLRIIIR